MVSSKDLNGMLTNLMRRRMIQYFTSLKNNSLTHYDENHKKMYTVLKKMGEKMR